MTDLPEFVGSHKILKKLGQGGFATVYLAYAGDKDEPQVVALKALNSPESYARFKREIETVAGLDHPNIIRIFDTGAFETTIPAADENGVEDKSDSAQESRGLANLWSGQEHSRKSRSSEALETVAVSEEAKLTLPYFTMEYVPGGALRDRLNHEVSLPRQEAVNLIKQVGAALTYAHEQGLIHRDVNPNNILLDTNQQPMRPILTDFGMAKPLKSEIDVTTMTVGLVGTFHYYAPEQWGKTTLTPATDLYALAITFFEMLAGQRPFQGDIFKLRDKHLNETLPPLSTAAPQIGVFFDAVLCKATAKDPAARYESIAAFIAALEAANEEATDAAHYQEIQRLIDQAEYAQALARLSSAFIRPGKYDYRDVSRLLWGLVYTQQHGDVLPPDWDESVSAQTKPLPEDMTFRPLPETPQQQAFDPWHALNKYLIPLWLGLAMLIGAMIAPQIPATLKSPPVQIAAFFLLVASLLYYTWVYYIGPKRNQ